MLRRNVHRPLTPPVELLDPNVVDMDPQQRKLRRAVLYSKTSNKQASSTIVNSPMYLPFADERLDKSESVFKRDFNVKTSDYALRRSMNAHVAKDSKISHFSLERDECGINDYTSTTKRDFRKKNATNKPPKYAHSSAELTYPLLVNECGDNESSQRSHIMNSVYKSDFEKRQLPHNTPLQTANSKHSTSICLGCDRVDSDHYVSVAKAGFRPVDFSALLSTRAQTKEDRSNKYILAAIEDDVDKNPKSTSQVDYVGYPRNISKNTNDLRYIEDIKSTHFSFGQGNPEPPKSLYKSHFAPVMATNDYTKSDHSKPLVRDTARLFDDETTTTPSSLYASDFQKFDLKKLVGPKTAAKRNKEHDKQVNAIHDGLGGLSAETISVAKSDFRKRASEQQPVRTHAHIQPSPGLAMGDDDKVKWVSVAHEDYITLPELKFVNASITKRGNAANFSLGNDEITYASVYKENYATLKGAANIRPVGQRQTFAETRSRIIPDAVEVSSPAAPSTTKDDFRAYPIPSMRAPAKPIESSTEVTVAASDHFISVSRITYLPPDVVRSG